MTRRERRLKQAISAAIKAWDNLYGAESTFLRAWQEARQEERREAMRSVLGDDYQDLTDEEPREIFANFGA